MLKLKSEFEIRRLTEGYVAIGYEFFDAAKAPIVEPVDIMDIGFACAYLATSNAKRIMEKQLYR